MIALSLIELIFNRRIVVAVDFGQRRIRFRRFDAVVGRLVDVVVDHLVDVVGFVFDGERPRDRPDGVIVL